MDSSTQIKGLISYLTKLTHTVDAFRVSFGNIEVGKTTRNMQSYVQIKYDLNVTPKQPDSPYLWYFFNCKSKPIIKFEQGLQTTYQWYLENMVDMESHT